MLNFYLPSIIFSCLFTFSFYFSFPFLSLFSTHSHKKSGKFTPKTWYESGIFFTFGCRFPPKSTNFGTLHLINCCVKSPFNINWRHHIKWSSRKPRKKHRPNGIRTPDLSIRSQTRYPLDYHVGASPAPEPPGARGRCRGVSISILSKYQVFWNKSLFR